jgi:hypothetical protein
VRTCYFETRICSKLQRLAFVGDYQGRVWTCVLELAQLPALRRLEVKTCQLDVQAATGVVAIQGSHASFSL